eukprot:11346_4
MIAAVAVTAADSAVTAMATGGGVETVVDTARGAEGTVVTGMTRIRCVVVVEEEEVGKRSRVKVVAVAGVIQRGLIFLRERIAAATTGRLAKIVRAAKSARIPSTMRTRLRRPWLRFRAGSPSQRSCLSTQALHLMRMMTSGTTSTTTKTKPSWNLFESSATLIPLASRSLSTLRTRSRLETRC